MAEVVLVTGNHAAAYATKSARVQVIAAYPITPQSSTVEKVSEFVEGGELKAEFIRLESGHTAMSALIGASATGVRTFTATSAQGLALMHKCYTGRRHRVFRSLCMLPIVRLLRHRASGVIIKILFLKETRAGCNFTPKIIKNFSIQFLWLIK